MSETSGRERRRHERRTMGGSAMLSAGGSWCGPYTVEDLSPGGARLLGPPPPEEVWVQVVLELPGGHRVVAAARTVWSDGRSLAITFVDLAEDEAMVIAAAVRSAGDQGASV